MLGERTRQVPVCEGHVLMYLGTLEVALKVGDEEANNLELPVAM